jgi:hypothetical protein
MNAALSRFKWLAPLRMMRAGFDETSDPPAITPGN